MRKEERLLKPEDEKKFSFDYFTDDKFIHTDSFNKFEKQQEEKSGKNNNDKK